ncbi:probable G-protein coupled receptor 88 [Octodon degus]|uniref:Probable G-protein coupled receptor 88 n=1 Tax=Octodon degus TaxID=10160 RepID=A0A6P3F1X9_OCTDE|nr:probable G-protein coupled receptor 88 [Octodon degus]
MSNASSASTTGEPLPLLCEEEEPWAGRRIPVSLLYSGLAIGGTLANGMVIYLVSSFRKLQTTSNAFIVNGCAADLSVCALWMPQEAVLGLLPAGAAGPAGDWGAAGRYRLLRGALLGLGLTASLLSHGLVALNRYLLITRAPATYHCVFLLATQPLAWVSLARGLALPVPWGVQAASWLLCCALSALNPLLYTWRNEEFRRSVRSVLPGVGDAAAAAVAATAVPAVSQAQLGTRAAGQHW